MEQVLISYCVPSIDRLQFQRLISPGRLKFSNNSPSLVRVNCLSGLNKGASRRKIPKNLRYPRRPKLPRETGNRFIKKKVRGRNPFEVDTDSKERVEESDDNVEEEEEDGDDSLTWSPDEIDAISSLFQGRVPQKPGRLTRVRPLPLPTPHKIRPLGLPATKKYVRSASPSTLSQRSSFSNQIYKNPDFLIGLAREIRGLPSTADASEVLDQWRRFLRKGSLSLTIRELGHMGLPERALQTFCWAQKHPQLFPDDRILASTVEILARYRELKLPFGLEKFMNSASRSVVEATAKGLIRAGSFGSARKLLLIAKDNNRTLDPSIHAKMILELGKNPDGYKLVLALLNELGEREDLKLKQQDCTAVMKVCTRLGNFEAAESLFNWFKESGQSPSVVMYTTLIHSRYYAKKFREAWAAVWEMEESNCLLDLPAYRVVIKLSVSLNDLSRSVRYFSKLKEAGFAPTYDIYRDMIKVYAFSGRWAMVKQMCKEVEMAGFKLDKEIGSLLSQMEEIRSVS